VSVAYVRLRDLTSGDPVGHPFTGHTDWVRAVTVAELDGRPVVVSGADDNTVRVCDLRPSGPASDASLVIETSAGVLATSLHVRTLLVATNCGIVAIELRPPCSFRP
jgi:WD40 repeat protein